MAQESPKVFICYAREDMKKAQRLYKDLKNAGVNPWMDTHDLKGGQKWKVMISHQIKQSSQVLVLLSQRTLTKTGYVRREINKALDLVDERPPDESFLIPIRVEECNPKDERLQELHWIDLFPDTKYPEGFRKILTVVCPEMPSPPAVPIEYIENEYGDQGKVIVDHATGLMWQKSGSGRLSYEKTVEYMKQLNDKPFAGYDDWRLPTVKELTSLLEPKKSSHGLYLDPIFDEKQNHCWSADTGLSGSAYVVYFDDRNVLHQRNLTHKLYVRAVRSIKEQEPPKQVKEAPSVREIPKVTLRREPIEVSEEEFRRVFGLDDKRRPLEYIENEYEGQGEVIVDHATGVMWQRSGADVSMQYKDTQAYVDRLNNNQFAGHTDWRLPTIPELLSLIERDRQSNDLFIKPLFDSQQRWCWSADITSSSSGAAWGVGFGSGYVDLLYLKSNFYVRCVRP